MNILVFQTPYISWNQNLFDIKNNKQEKINIGSKVLVGGFVARLSEISNAGWLDALPKNCVLLGLFKLGTRPSLSKDKHPR